MTRERWRNIRLARNECFVRFLNPPDLHGTPLSNGWLHLCVAMNELDEWATDERARLFVNGFDLANPEEAAFVKKYPELLRG